MSQAIVNQIKEAIFQKKLKVGDKLPSERQLMEQFEASRVTVREALRILEQSGILEIRRGIEGGAYVRDPNTKFINSFLQDMFSLGKIKIPDLTEARLAVEPFSARLATERCNEENLTILRKNIEETKECLDKKNYEDARLLNLEFHRLIAQTSRNMVIFFMIDSMMDIMENNIASIVLSPLSVFETAKYHEQICDAMEKGEMNRAEEIMFKHIEQLQRALEVRKENGEIKE